MKSLYLKIIYFIEQKHKEEILVQSSIIISQMEMSFALCCDVNTEEMDNHSCGALSN